MFALMLVAYAQNLMGGGDLKILTFAFLWVGIPYGLPFAVLLFVFRSLHTIAAKLGWVGAQRLEGRTRIAFAPAVAGALIGSFRWDACTRFRPRSGNKLLEELSSQRDAVCRITMRESRCCIVAEVTARISNAHLAALTLTRVPKSLAAFFQPLAACLPRSLMTSSDHHLMLEWPWGSGYDPCCAGGGEPAR